MSLASLLSNLISLACSVVVLVIFFRISWDKPLLRKLKPYRKVVFALLLVGLLVNVPRVFATPSAAELRIREELAHAKEHVNFPRESGPGIRQDGIRQVGTSTLVNDYTLTEIESTSDDAKSAAQTIKNALDQRRCTERGIVEITAVGIMNSVEQPEVVREQRCADKISPTTGCSNITLC